MSVPHVPYSFVPLSFAVLLSSLLCVSLRSFGIKHFSGPRARLLCGFRAIFFAVTKDSTELPKVTYKAITTQF